VRGDGGKQCFESPRDAPAAQQRGDQDEQEIDPEGLRYELRQQDFDCSPVPDSDHAEKDARQDQVEDRGCGDEKTTVNDFPHVCFQ
jgi:hypothetical protein